MRYLEAVPNIYQSIGSSAEPEAAHEGWAQYRYLTMVLVGKVEDGASGS